MAQVDRKIIPLKPGFNLAKHRSALEAQVVAKFGDGWTLRNVSDDGTKATFERRAAITQVTETEEKVTLGLPGDLAKPSAGDMVAAQYQDTYPGFYLTKFDPHLGRAEMTKLTPGAVRTRAALAVVLSCKPWDIQIATQPDGGYALVLPDSYMPSRHDDKLTEVTVTVAGQVGWRLQVNPATLQARMIPGEPPLFPDVVAYPMDELGPNGDVDRTPIGVTMPDEGVGYGQRVVIDWTDSSWFLMGGTPGSGKSVTINDVVAHQLSTGAELVIVDDRSKAVDFDWCKKYVRPGGWGCDSEKQAVAALAMIYEEGQKRAAKMREMGLNNWLDMKPGERFTPITIIVDEVSALLVLDPVPKGVSKDNPIVIETNELNYMRQMIGRYINKIIAEQRFVGMRMLMASQITNNNTGISPSTKGKIGHRGLQGNNPSNTQRDQIFNDSKNVPTVPPHIQSSGKAARGVGVADLEGQSAVVYKSFFASVQDFAARFAELGIPTTDQPEPTALQIAKYAPALDDDAVSGPRADTPSGKPLDPKFGPVETFDADGNKLFGAAAAAAASKQITLDKDNEAVKPGPPCPQCGQPINDGCTC